MSTGTLSMTSEARRRVAMDIVERLRHQVNRFSVENEELRDALRALREEVAALDAWVLLQDFTSDHALREVQRREQAIRRRLQQLRRQDAQYTLAKERWRWQTQRFLQWMREQLEQLRRRGGDVQALASLLQEMERDAASAFHNQERWMARMREWRQKAESALLAAEHRSKGRDDTATEAPLFGEATLHFAPRRPRGSTREASTSRMRLEALRDHLSRFTDLLSPQEYLALQQEQDPRRLEAALERLEARLADIQARAQTLLEHFGESVVLASTLQALREALARQHWRRVESLLQTLEQQLARPGFLDFLYMEGALRRAFPDYRLTFLAEDEALYLEGEGTRARLVPQPGAVYVDAEQASDAFCRRMELLARRMGASWQEERRDYRQQHRARPR